MRWRLVRRGLLLYGGGLVFDFIWPGTILPFYGAMFVIAAGLFTLRIRWIVALGVAAALAAWAIRWWLFEQNLDNESTRWLTDPEPRSVRGLLFDVFVNGTHPLLPWLAFFCAGIVLGRLLVYDWWRPAAAGLGFALFAGATLISGAASSERALVLFSDAPRNRGLIYVSSALGTALLAFAGISWIADRFERTPVVDGLRRAGQLSLTIYLGHALFFNLMTDWLGIIEPAGIGTALAWTAIYWLPATAAAVEYQKRHGRGPAEYVYRRLTV